MRTKQMLTTCLFGVLCGVALGPVAPAADLARGDVEIQIRFAEGKEYGTIDVQALVPAPPRAVWQLYTRVNSWRLWMPMVIDAFFYSAQAAAAIPQDVEKDERVFGDLRRRYPGTAVAPGGHGVETRVAYESYDLPWPIANNWAVHRYTYDARRADHGTFEARWVKVYERNPVGSAGLFRVEPFPGQPDATLLTYQFRTKAKSGLTLALFRMGVRRSIDRFVAALRAEVAKP